MTFTYSPHPIEAYRVPFSQACVATHIHLVPFPQAAWNLLWLSTPQLDLLPALEDGWITANAAVVSMLVHVLPEVESDGELAAQLLRHPEQFLAWFSKEDFTIFDCYHILGPEWAETVLDRAEQAARRLNPLVEGVVKVENNVFTVDFARVGKVA